MADFINELVKKINKELDGEVALLIEDGSSTDVKLFIPTGATTLDFIGANRRNGGIPVGRISTWEGLESCVHPDTEIETIVDNENLQKIKVADVQKLLEQGKKIKVKTVGGQLTSIKSFINKGYLKSVQVELNNGFTIIVSLDHLFFTSIGWTKAKNLIVDESEILCDDGLYHKVKIVQNKGFQPIVDIEVEHEDHCYFGNGMLNHNTGKSLLAMQAMANAQKMGGLCIYMDTEHALSAEFAERVGLDVHNNFIHMFPATVEDGFTSIYKLIESINADEVAAKKEERELSYKFVLIVWDSVTATPTKLDLAAQNPDPSASVAVKARTISKNMALLVGSTQRANIAIVFVNQLRRKIGTTPGQDPWEVPGGKAIPYYSSLRIRLTSSGRLKIAASGDTVGIKTKAKILKTRFGPPFRTADFPIYFTHGIDDEEAILDCLVEHKKVAKLKGGQKGNLFHFKDENKETAISKREFKQKLASDEIFKEKAQVLLEQALVKDMIDPRKADLELDAEDSEGDD